MSESSADMLDQQLQYASIAPEYLEGLRASHAAAKDDPEKMFQFALVGVLSFFGALRRCAPFDRRYLLTLFSPSLSSPSASPSCTLCTGAESIE